MNLLKRLLIILVVLALVLWIGVFFKRQSEDKAFTEKMRDVKRYLKATKLYTVENNTGNFVDARITVKSQEEIYNICKSAFPKIVESGVLEDLQEFETLSIVAKIVDESGATKATQGIQFPLHKIGNIEWDKISNFDSLLNYSSLMN